MPAGQRGRPRGRQTACKHDLQPEFCQQACSWTVYLAQLLNRSTTFMCHQRLLVRAGNIIIVVTVMEAMMSAKMRVWRKKNRKGRVKRRSTESILSFPRYFSLCLAQSVFVLMSFPVNSWGRHLVFRTLSALFLDLKNVVCLFFFCSDGKFSHRIFQASLATFLFSR